MTHFYGEMTHYAGACCLLLADAAALIEHAHGVGEVLRGDDAYDAVAFEDGDHLGPGPAMMRRRVLTRESSG